MPIILGVHASANKAIQANFRLTLKRTADNVVIYQNDLLSTMMSFVSSYSAAGNITQPLTLQFNSSFNYVLDSTLAFDLNNNGNLFTVKANTGMYPTIDGNNVLTSTLDVAMSNFIWDGIGCINSNINDTAGCIVRTQPNTSNITFRNMKFKRGYCAMRATGTVDGSGNVTGFIDGLTIKNCTVEDTANGSFRIGNGDAYSMPASANFSLRTAGYYDVRNVTIEDVTLIDNFNKGVITGQTTGFMGMLILKRISNLTVKNFLCNNTSESFLQIDGCSNVLVNKVIIDSFGCRGLGNQQGVNVDNTDGCTIINAFVKANADGIGKLVANFDNVRSLSLLHNTFTFVNQGDNPCYGKDISLLRMVGNIFKASGSSNPCEMSFSMRDGYVPTIAKDLIAENYNVFCSDGTYNTNFILTTPNEALFAIKVQINPTGTKISPATYRSTYNLGINSVFTTDTAVAFASRTNPNNTTSLALYLTETSQGRNLVPSMQLGVNIDTFGFLRTFPTDAGACDKDAIVLA